MGFLPSNKLAHADSLSCLIPRFCELLEKTVIATLRAESKIKNMLCNTVRDFPVTLPDIKIKTRKGCSLLMKRKKQVRWNLNEKIRKVTIIMESYFPYALLFGERIVMPISLQKKVLNDFYQFCAWSPSHAVMCLKNLWNHGKCALAANEPLIKLGNWFVIDKFTSFAWPINGLFYLIGVDSFTKWPQVLKCKRSISIVTIKFLHELFARFSCPETIITDNATVHIKRFLNVLQFLCNQSYHKAPFSGEVRSYAEENSKEIWP